eukprot:TRINITY_DN29910_c0_g1_i1.p1 TRINITY_DN29910_c0_g1~~TRINITY_DN29910_c0_g1_i1.p1  ORF type:complete len:191 (-),score=13.14 TRINITY_DN29910_c0_g1_i1:2-550(-)
MGVEVSWTAKPVKFTTLGVLPKLKLPLQAPEPVRYSVSLKHKRTKEIFKSVTFEVDLKGGDPVGLHLCVPPELECDKEVGRSIKVTVVDAQGNAPHSIPPSITLRFSSACELVGNWDAEWDEKDRAFYVPHGRIQGSSGLSSLQVEVEQAIGLKPSKTEQFMLKPGAYTIKKNKGTRIKGQE